MEMVTQISSNLLIALADLPHRRDREIEGVYRRPSNIGRIFIPAGEYELTDQLVITNRAIIIEGEGIGLSTLIWNGTGPAISFINTDSTSSIGAAIKDLTIKSTSPQFEGVGVYIEAGIDFTIRDVKVTGFDGVDGRGLSIMSGSENIRLDNVILDSNEIGLETDNIKNSTFTNIILNENSIGNALFTRAENIQWSGGKNNGSATDYGIRVSNCDSVSINGLTSNLLGPIGYAIETAGTNRNINVSDGYFNIQSSPKRFVNFNSVSAGQFSNNYIVNPSPSDEQLTLTDSVDVNVAAQPGIAINPGSGSSFEPSLRGLFINVKDFGAKGDGVTDDSTAVQSAISYLSTSGSRAPIYFPPGTYIFNSTISLPVSIQGLELIGAGWTETDATATTLRNNSSGPMFQTSGTGTFAHFKCHQFRMLQSPSAGYYFQFDNLTVHMEISRIHCNMSNTGAGCIWMNGVENHMNWIHDMKVVTSGATVPMFWWDGPATSNMTTCTFQRITCNTPGATTAPQYLIDNKWTTASPGFKWDTINMEQPNGGGIHLYGIAGALMQNVITGDTASQTASVYLFDKSHTLQSLLEATLIQCNSFIGTQAQPDLVIRNSIGGVFPGPVNIIGGRFGWFNPGTFGQIHMTGGTVAGYTSGTRPPMRVYSGALLGVKGIGRTHSAVPVDLARHFAGTATFASSNTLTVNFTAGDLGGADPEANTNYEIIITPTANETIWVDNASKTTTAFTLMSSNPTSTAKVVWMMIRP